MSLESTLIVAASKADVPKHLNGAIVDAWRARAKPAADFTIALSGGSLPSFLSTLPDAFSAAGIDDPKFESWHVLLADERCVPSTHPDSNLGSLKEKFLQHVPIPAEQVHGINESLLSDDDSSSTKSIATDYEAVLKKALECTDGKLDLAVLGFGPDGHTCSLFPGHDLLQEKTALVAPIEDSPKPPPKRITLTLPVLNDMTRKVIFCGAGASKSPILQAVFSSIACTGDEGGTQHKATMTAPPPYPCGMAGSSTNAVTWVVDADAAEGLSLGGSS